jgi:hypothetical protein
MRQSDESFDLFFFFFYEGWKEKRGECSAGSLHPTLARVHPGGGAWCGQDRRTCELFIHRSETCVSRKPSRHSNSTTVLIYCLPPANKAQLPRACDVVKQ